MVSVNRRDFLKAAASSALIPIVGVVNAETGEPQLEWTQEGLERFFYWDSLRPNGKDHESLEAYAKARAILSLDLKRLGVEPDISRISLGHIGFGGLGSFGASLDYRYALSRLSNESAHKRIGIDIFHDKESRDEARDLSIRARYAVTEARWERKEFDIPITEKLFRTILVHEIYELHAKRLLVDAGLMEDDWSCRGAVLCQEWQDVHERIRERLAVGEKTCDHDDFYVASYLTKWGIFREGAFPVALPVEK